MTSIVKKNSATEVESQQMELLSTAIPENDELAQIMEDTKLYVSGEKMESGYMVPRFGLLSLKARATPMYVYDHPRFRKITNTAFTDGVHLFICADFMRQLMKEEDASNGMEQGIVPLVLHELMHMILNHTRRLTQFPRDIANQAEDLSINAKLQLGFPEIQWAPSLREVGLSFRAGDVEKYAKLAEETIARELMQQKPPQNQNQNQQQQQQKGGQGSCQQGGGGGQQQKGQQGGQQGQQQQQKGDQGDQQEQDGEKGDQEWDNNHTVPLEDFIEALEEAGLDHIRDALDLPESQSLEEIGKIEEQVRLKDIDAIQKAAMQKAQMGGKYPGAHIVDAAQEMVKGLTAGKLEWKLGLKSFIFGEGMRFRYNEMEPGDIYYVDPSDMGLSMEIFIGQDLPHKPEEVILVLIDTSGSVDSNQLKAYLSEVFGLKRENAGLGDTASEVVVISADTVVRGNPIEITEENADELFSTGLALSGRGGTDLANDLRMTMKLPMFEEKKFSGVVFFTDLCDNPPTKNDFPSNLPLCFITLPHLMQEEFARKVKEFARVYPIEDGITVDLTDDHLQTAVNTRKQKM
jgi:predicted metal-dependent peptidase